MTKADKQLIKALQNIKEYCKQQENCLYCRFDSAKQPFCQIMKLRRALKRSPNDWDMDIIERIITNNDV